MVRKSFVLFFVVWLTALLFVSVAHAEIKVTEGAAFRLRQEIWDDVVDLDTLGKPDRNFFRLRYQVWGKADFNPNFSAYLRLTGEPKYHIGPFRVNADRDHLEENEVLFDNLFVDAKDIFGLPVDLKVGRQDFLGPDMYGEGFLIMDGTPGDGSRTFYFNAARARVKLTKVNTIDLVYITDTKQDTYMPVLHTPQKVQLTTSNEQAFVLYSRNKIGDTATIEPYYMYKTEKGFGSITKLKLNTIGARAVVGIGGGWNLGGEYAHQWGEYDNGTDRSGNGGYVFVSRKYDTVNLKPEFDLRFVYLSGDDPATSEVESWNPLFSRNPYWNEVLIYSLPNETAGKLSGPLPGYWTNLEILKASVKLNFSPATALNLAYQYLWAPEKPAVSGGAAAMFGTGSSRGHLPTAILTHKFNANLDGMLQLEHFIPESYYSSKADSATFFRWQLQFKI